MNCVLSRHTLANKCCDTGRPFGSLETRVSSRRSALSAGRWRVGESHGESPCAAVGVRHGADGFVATEKIQVVLTTTCTLLVKK